MNQPTPPTQIAYFFIPLSEALGVPEGFKFAVNRQESFDEYMKRVSSLDADNNDDSPLPDTWLTASLKFWHGSVPHPDMDRIDQLFIVAQKALPGLPAPKPVEFEKRAAPVTIVEMAVPLESGVEDPLSVAFDEGLRVLRAFQRAYHLVRKIPLKLVSRQRLPGFIPFGVRTISDDADEWPSGLNLMLLNWNYTPLSRDADLTPAEVEQLQVALDAQPGSRVFASYADLRRDAMNSLNIDGDHRAAVLFFAAASEVLLDDLLAHMLWEEGVRPEDGAVLFEGGFQRRLRTAYHPRLRGSGWGLNIGALRQWNDDIATIRHRVIHAGYDVTSQEAERAGDALLSLETFIAERLLSRRSIRKYPRTAMALYGRPGLERRQKWDKRLQELGEDPSETPWAPTFLRWKATMQRCRSERPPEWVEPRVDEALVVGVVHPGPTLIWVLHDRNAHMARRAAAPHVITDEQAASFAMSLAERSPDTAPESWAMFGARAEPLPAFDWVPEYRLLPMAGVMVTGDDLDPPIAPEPVTSFGREIVYRVYAWCRAFVGKV